MKTINAMAMLSNSSPPNPWGTIPAPASAALCGFASCPPPPVVRRNDNRRRRSPSLSVPPSYSCAVAMSPLPPPPSFASRHKRMSTSLRGGAADYSAEWIDLLSSDSYGESSTTAGVVPPPPGRIDPPRSGAVSFSNGAGDELFTFAGYAELNAPSVGEMPERFVVNDLWEFVPHNAEDSSLPWGWAKVAKADAGGATEGECVPGPRLATALAVLPSSKGGEGGDRAVLVGGWDPQTPGTGGVILDDVNTFDLESREWSAFGSAERVPDGPTSRHVAVTLTIEGGQQVVCVHNHRCSDHVLLLSESDDGERGMKWKKQSVAGDAPSSRGLHCAAPLANGKSMAVFGGAAQDGLMSNESYVLDAETWTWTKLDCGSDDDGIPSPRAGACLCPLDDDAVLLFGGATPGEGGGLVGLNDVWTLRIDRENGKGSWKCLVENRSDDDDGIVRPPGRNAHTLSRIDADKLLPNGVTLTGDERSNYYLLQVRSTASLDWVHILC